jgi:hypothetical protein
VPASRLDDGAAFVQLVSFKTPDGRAPAFSRVIPLPSNAQALGGRMSKLLSPLPVAASMTLAQAPFQAPRHIPCVQSPDGYAREASLDELLAGIVKVAAPVVLKMLGSGATSAGGRDTGAAGSTAAAGSPVADVVSFLLKSLLSGVNAAPAAAPSAASPAAPVAAPAAAVPTAHAQSLGMAQRNENRFTAARRTQWSRPFIFGIDDALIGALAGPILSVLPQLVNAANQARLQTQQGDNKLIGDALAEVNKRMLMERLIQAQQSAPTNSQAELAQLRALLEQAQSASPAAVKAQSLAMSAATKSAASTAPTATPSERAVLTFVTADPIEFNGAQHCVFVRDHDAELKVRFTVGEPVPKSALPRAILTVTLKGSHKPADWVTSTAKLHDVAPNGVLTITVSQHDLARLPANRKIPIVAELRWPASQGRTAYSATGATDIVLVDKYFVRERGGPVGEERELTDMNQYRAFWNKVWEAPTLDALTSTDGRKKSLWALDATARYLVLLTARQQANGLMETKLKTTPPDPDALTLTVGGRLKGGVELTIGELNKLRALWDGQSPLDAEHLAALQSDAIAHANSAEFVTNLRLKGRAGERGMVWIVPVFRMVQFTLSSVQKTDDAGQVVAVADETIQFPMPVAARVLGLTSN